MSLQSCTTREKNLSSPQAQLWKTQLNYGEISGLVHALVLQKVQDACEEGLEGVHSCTCRPRMRPGCFPNNRRQNCWGPRGIRCTVLLLRYMIKYWQTMSGNTYFDSSFQSLVVGQAWQNIPPYSTHSNRSMSWHLVTGRRVVVENPR